MEKTDYWDKQVFSSASTLGASAGKFYAEFKLLKVDIFSFGVKCLLVNAFANSRSMNRCKDLWCYMMELLINQSFNNFIITVDQLEV